MSKDPASTTKGSLLSKVVRFVSSPTTHWADLDRPEGAADAHDSRLALKEMIERKRRNDFVRNREFDQLRKLRRREISYVPDLGVHSSFSTSSQFADTDERARTLRKIDEIEEQMSNAWLQSKGAGASASPSGPAAMPPQGAATDSEDALPHEADVDQATTLAPSPVPTTHFAPTVPLETPLEHPQASSGAAELTEGEPPASMLNAEDFGGTDDTAAGRVTGGSFDMRAGLELPSELGSVPKLEPEIEEAAIRFANGDSAGAEAGLLAVLRDPAAQACQDAWLTLFDLYRATGEQDKFDDVAIDFAGQFGRSAPQWTLGPETPTVQAPLQASLQPGLSISPPNGALAHWTAPSTLTVQSLIALKAVLERHASPWRIDWRYLKALDPAVAPVLVETLDRWADTPVGLRFIGGERLMELLCALAPVDDRSADPVWWAARLALLRVMGEMDEFELVALKYCVTYEVSPPAWQEPGNSFEPLTAEGESALPADLGLDVEGHAQTEPGSMSKGDVPVWELGREGLDEQRVLKAELHGELLGDADAVLAALQIHAANASIEFNCSQLERVDFGAAGSLLNWASDQKRQGRQVIFKHVNRLVAAFFGVVGISEVARVRLRKD